MLSFSVAAKMFSIACRKCTRINEILFKSDSALWKRSIMLRSWYRDNLET